MVHVFYLRIIFQTLQQHLIRHRTRRRITVLLPVLMTVHGYKRQHIYRSFKEKQMSACAVPMKTVLRFTAGCIALIWLCGYRATLVSMAWVSVLIVAYEHSVMMTFRFVQHFLSDKFLYYALIQSSRKQQISKHSPHIIILCRQNKGLFSFWRLMAERNLRSCMTAKEHLHRITVTFMIESADKVNAVAALLLVLMEPKITSDSHFLTAIQPHIFRTALLDFLALCGKKSDKVGRASLLFFFP